MQVAKVSMEREACLGFCQMISEVLVEAHKVLEAEHDGIKEVMIVHVLPLGKAYVVCHCKRKRPEGGGGKGGGEGRDVEECSQAHCRMGAGENYMMNMNKKYVKTTTFHNVSRMQ